jgi:hypothetical protein
MKPANHHEVDVAGLFFAIAELVRKRFVSAIRVEDRDDE